MGCGYCKLVLSSWYPIIVMSFAAYLSALMLMSDVLLRAPVDVPDGLGLYCMGPCKVPPEFGFWAVTAHGYQAGVAAHGTQGDSWYEVSDWAGFGGVVRRESTFN